MAEKYKNEATYKGLGGWLETRDEELTDVHEPSEQRHAIDYR